MELMDSCCFCSTPVGPNDTVVIVTDSTGKDIVIDAKRDCIASGIQAGLLPETFREEVAEPG